MAKEYLLDGSELVESESKPVVFRYRLRNLKNDKELLEKEIASLQAKLTEIDALILKAEELGLVDDGGQDV